MSHIHAYRDELQRGFQIDGFLSENDVFMKQQEAVAAVKRQLICAVVDILMEKLGPKLEAAIEQAFTPEEKS